MNKLTTDEFKTRAESLGCREFDVKQTFEQIRQQFPIAPMLWGMEGLMSVNDKGFLFKVNTPNLKGCIIITLNGLDLYNVNFFTMNFEDQTLTEKSEVLTDLYFDKLAESINDKLIINGFSE